MTKGKHECNKSENDPTFSKEWSGVSYADHSGYNCPNCGEKTHDEAGNLYCPRCDNYVGSI